LNDEERQAYLDKQFPFVEAGAPPPGRYIPDSRGPGFSTWSGPSGWRTRHGVAAVWWSYGRSFKVEWARYPDGTRGIAQHVLDYGWRRRAGDGRRWVHGTIEIGSDDVVFADGQQPVYGPPQATGLPNLEADLAHDAEFLNALQDDRFANAVYMVFRNRTFYKGTDERSWSCGDREAARLIRDLRGLGESYQDWFPYGRLDGIYPDDRLEQEAALRKHLEQSSQPLDFQQLILHLVPEAHRAEVQRQIEAMRAEFEKRAPAAEAQRLESLERANRALSGLDENADVFAALHAHLSRLGWRTANAEDRARAERKRIDGGIVLLQDIKEFEKRPDDRTPDWAERLRPRPPAAGDDVAGPLRSLDRSRTGAYPSIVLAYRNPPGTTPPKIENQMAADEREVRSGGLRKRLDRLAISGRISKEEYDDLSARLRAAGYW